jgi:FkbM family methyltransferase
MGLRGSLAALFEGVLKARIVRPDNIGPLFEERHLYRFFRYFKIDCVFDVGANAGQYATMIRERAAYTGPIISFEPNPEVAAILREKARRDGRWFVEEVALGAISGQATFNVATENQMSSLHEPQTTETELFVGSAAIKQTINVTTSTLDVEVPKYRQKLGFKRPFLKMDTQGHDIEVALGAGNMLRDFVGLQSELAIKRVYANAPRYEDAIKFYSDRGFILSALVPNNSGFFPYLIEMDCIMFRGDIMSGQQSI